MGSTITSPVDMMSYAGDLRRAAKQATALETAEKMQRSAADLEKTALSRLGHLTFGVGQMLDILA
jgi:hypothetical protein